MSADEEFAGQGADQAGPQDSDRSSRPALYSSAELLRGHSEAWIEHAGQWYRLRVTSKGNLILTK